MIRSSALHSVKLSATQWFNLRLPLYRACNGVRLAAAVAIISAAGCASDTPSSQDSPTRPNTRELAATTGGDASDHTRAPRTNESPAEGEKAGGSSPTQADTGSESVADLQLFPHIRATKVLDRIEIDARVSPMLVVDPRTPLFFLETICCAPDTREHESLLVSDAKPSHVHAALLAMGLTPGKPGAWEMRGQELVPLAPTGDRVSVRFQYTSADGIVHHVSPLVWITSTRVLATTDAKSQTSTRQSTSPANATSGGATGLIMNTLPANSTVEWWVFAGSRMIKRPDNAATTPGASPQHSAPATAYDADGTGQIIGLHTFGSEVLAWPVNLNPDASALEPEWIAKMDAIPPAGTPVTIVIRKADQPQMK